MTPRQLVRTIEAAGISQARLERALMLSPGYLSKVKRGRKKGSGLLNAALALIAFAPEVEVEWLEKRQRESVASRARPSTRC